MSAPDHVDRAAAMVAAAKDRHKTTRQRAVDALQHLDAVGEEVSFASVDRADCVSRAWLYRDPALRAEIEQIRTIQQPNRSKMVRPVVEHAHNVAHNHDGADPYLNDAIIRTLGH